MRRALRCAAAAALGACAFAASAEVGVSDSTITLGQSAALSGPAAQLGIQMRLGAKVYFDALNKAGGVHGRQVELRTRDDRYEASQAAINTTALIEQDKVFALFGYVGTPTSNAALPIFTKAQVPFFAPFTGAISLREPLNRYVFNIRASYFDETEKIVEHLTSTGAKRIAVFYQNDAYGKTGLDGTVAALAARGLKPVAAATVERNSSDVEQAVRVIARSDADTVMMVSAYTSVAAFVRAMKNAGYTGQFHNVSFVGSKALADALGPDAVGMQISQVMPFPFASAIPIVREYQRAMTAAGQTDFNWSSLEGYIGAKVLCEAMRRTGRDLTRERLIAALESMSRYDVGGMNIGFSPSSHNGSRFVELTLVDSKRNFVR